MKPAIAPLNRLLRDLFRVEPLEARILLSADPVLGAVQIVLNPPEQDAAAVLAEAYAAPADVNVATTAGSTVLVANGAPQQALPPQWLLVDTAQLADGNGRVVVGGPDSNAVIHVGTADSALQLGDLVLVNPQAGGEVHLDGALQLTGSLLISGSGHTTTVSADTTTTDDIAILDSVLIVGDRLLQAGTDGTGIIQLGNTTVQTVNGNGDATADTLVLRAPDNIRFTGQVGNTDPLEGLTIEAVSVAGSPNTPFNIDFGREVTVNGDLIINASGTVTFSAKVTITNGGDLRIIGADRVVFAAGVELLDTDGLGNAGDLFIEANEIDFLGGTEVVKGQGILTMRPTNVGYGIDIGSLSTSPLQPQATTLNLDTNELKALADGFSRIVIGQQDGLHANALAGNVRIGAMDSLDVPLLRDPMEVYGNGISVEDLSNPDHTLLVQGTIKLDAHADITIANKVEANPGTGATDITLYSETGRIQQVDVGTDLKTSEPLRAATLTLHAATGISLPFTEITSVSAVNTASGDLTITETATGGDVAITLLSQQAVNAGIALKTTSGSISVGGTGIGNAGSGATDLQAAGSAKTITVNQAITSGTGTVKLTATGAITTNDNGTTTDGTITTGGAANIDLLSSAGAISQGGNITSAGGAIGLDAFTTLTMVDGVTASSVHPTLDTGAVSLRARGGNVVVSKVVADGTMALTASGAILDGLTGNNPNLDGETAAVLLAAASGIGGSGTPLQTKVGTLAATNTTTGGVFVREATALRLAGGGAGFALDAGGSTGDVSIVTVDGAITIDQAARSTGSTGLVLFQSGETVEGTAAGINVRANVSSTNGSISLVSSDGIVVDDLGAGAPTISVAAIGQTLDVEAADGIAMEAQARFATAGGSARLRANGGDIALGIVDVGSGSATLSASGAIVDVQNDDGNATPMANVVASSARMDAGANLGASGALVETQVATLAASAGGALFVAERDNVSIVSVAAVSVNRIGALGTISSNPADAGSLAGITSGGAALVLQAGGNLSVDQAIAGAGQLRVASTGTMNVTTAVSTTGGNLSAIAGGTLTMTAAGVFASSVGSVDLQSTGGAIAMAHGAVARTNAATIRAQAAGDVTVGLLDARTAADRAGATLVDALTWGTVSVVAGGAIADNAGETATDVYGSVVRLQAVNGIATAAEKLETETGQLSASAGAAGLFLTEATALNLVALGAIGVQRVGADGASAAGPTDAAQAGLASGGALVVQTLLGAITSGAGATVSAGGNVLLDAQGVASTLTLGAAASSSGGSISLNAAQDVLLNASVSTSAAGKTIDVRAGRHVAQAQGASLTTSNGNIALEATTGDVTLETANAGTTGGVWISGANVIDGDAAGDTEVDIGAASAQILATGGIGAAGAALETQLATITASAGTGLFVTESDGLAVDRLQLNVDRISAAGSASATAHAAQEDLSAPTVVLTSLAGDITLNAGTGGTAAVNGGSGNLRLQAASGNIVAAAAVNAGSGNATLLASGNITFLATGSVATSGGTIDLEATAGAIAMADGALAQTGGGSIRLKALNDVTVGRLDAGAGSVSIFAGGAIADNAEANVDVIAGSLRLQAGAGIGTGSDALETEVALLSATAGTGGMFLAEATAVTVTQTAAVSVNRVGTDGTTLTAQADGLQSGLTSGGVVVLQTANGTLTTTAQGAIAAAGNVFLNAVGATADLAIAAALSSSGGSIDLAAGQDALLNANLSTATAGKSIAVSTVRHIAQAQGTSVATTNGGVLLFAGGIVTLETVTAGTAGVGISAAGGLVDGDAAGDTEVDIVANRTVLISQAGIGAAGAQLETTVDILSARGTGDVFITETDAVALDLASVSYQRIDAAGAASNLTTVAAAGLSGQNVVLRTLNGGISNVAAATVTATGNLLLQATGASADLTLNGATSAAGALSLAAGRDVTLTTSVSTTNAGSSIDIQAQGRIDAQQGSAVTANNGNVQLLALGGSVTLETINAGTGTVRISGSNIVDGDTTPGEAEVDIIADKLLLTTGSAGTGANPLETSVTTLTVSATGIVGIVDSTGLVLGSVTASVDRVGTDGATTATAPVTQSNVTGSTVTLRTLAGPLVASASGAVTATGNLLLKALGATGDISIAAAVSSSAGNVTVDAARDLTQGANISTAAAGLTVDLLAGGNLEQLQGSALNTNNGHVSMAATGTLTLETVSAGVGRVSLSGASIVDGDAAGDTEVDVLAQGLRATATAGAIGSAANNLETTITTLSAVATGDVFVTETDALDLAVVSATVNRVANNGSSAPVTITGQNNVSGATVVVRTLAGTLSSQVSGAVLATGNLLLQAGGATSDLNLVGTIVDSGGNVSLAAGQDLLLATGVSATGSGKSVDLVAGRNFVQNQGMLVSTANGNIGLQAAGNATIETFNAGAGQLRIAAASVIDGDTAPSENEVDLIASAAQLVTTGAVGASANALETSVQTLAAATGDLYLAESDALTIGALTVNTQRVDVNGAAAATANAATSGIAAATTVVQAKAGSIDSLAGIAINAGGNLLLKATGAASDITLRGALTGGGFATLDAGRDLATQSAVTLTTAGRSLVLLAGRDFAQAEGASAATNNGAIGLTAIGNALVDTLSAGTAAVRIAAAGVVDIDADGDSEVDVSAGGLQLAVGGAVGTGTNALETSAATLTLQATGAAFITETDALSLGTVSISTQRVGADGTAQPVVTVAQSNLSGGAALVVHTLAGTLTSTAQGAVTAAGNLLFLADGAASDLGLNAAVTSSGGNLSLVAGRDLVLGANVATAAAGATIELRAGRDAVQAQGTSVATSNGSITLDAAGSATLENLSAGSAGVRVTAGAIVDGDAAGDNEVDIAAAGTQLRATGAIGAAGAALETSVDRLAAQAGGNLFVTESNDLLVGGVLVIGVRSVALDGTDFQVAQVGPIGLGGANTVLRTVDGALTIEQLVTATGNLLLQAGGAAGDLTVQAPTTSAAGAMSLVAGRDLLVAGMVTTTNAGSTIDLLAQGTLTTAEGSSVMANDANVLLAAGGSVTLESVRAGAGSVRVTGASLLDGDATGDTEVDIVAAQLQVTVTGAVGTPSGVLETTVGTLSVAAGGTILINESDALVIDTVSFAGVNRVGTDGATTGTGTVAQSDARSTGGAIAIGAAGDLTLAALAQVANTGGDVMLASQGALALNAQAGVSSSGMAVLSAANGISLATLATVSAAGNISLATLGAATLADQARLTSTAGNVLVDADGAVSLGADTVVSTGSGSVTLDAQGDLSLGTQASIAATGAVALTTPGALTLADSVTVSTSAGTILLDAGAALAIGAAANVHTDSGNVTLDAGAALSLGANTNVDTDAGTASLTAQGDLSLGTAASVAATGAIALATPGAVALADQATVTSTGGAVTLDAGTTLALGAAASVATGAGDVLLQADAALSLDTDASVTTGNGNATLAAGASLALGAGAQVDADGGTATLAAATTLALGNQASVSATAAASLSAVGNLSTGTGASVSSSGSTATLASSAGAIAVGSGSSIAGQAGATLGAQGSLTTGSNVAIASAGGSASLASSQADVALGAGTHVSGQTGATLTAQTDITLGVAAEVASATGGATLAAQAAMSLADQVRVTAAMAVDLSAVGNLDVGNDAVITSSNNSARLVSTAGVMTLGGNDVISGTTSATLSAQGGLSIGAATSVASSAGPVAIATSGALALGNQVSVSGAGPVGLDAVGNLGIGTDVTIASSGNSTQVTSSTAALSLGDRSSVAGQGGTSLSAVGNLTLGTSSQVSSNGGAVALSTQADLAVGTLAVVTGNGNVTFASVGDLALADHAAVTSNAGNVQLNAQGDLSLDTAAAVTATAGSVTLSADGVTLGTGAQVVASGALALTAAGDVALGLQSDLTSIGSAGITLATQGTLTLATDADIASGGGAIALSANGDVTLADQANVRTGGAATIDVTSATGSVLMDPNASSLQTGSGDIHVTAEGDIRPGALITSGKAFLDARNGRILIQGDLQRAGEDIDLFGDDLVITVPVSSPGGTLRIGPLDAGTSIFIGDGVPAGPALQVDTSELALLQDGFAQIAIGGSLANTAITLDGVTSPLVFRDPLLLTATGAGGTVTVNGSLTGDTLTIADAGSGTLLHNATVRMQGSVLVQDQLVVDGPTTMAAGTGGSGNLQFTQTVTGRGGAADTLALSAQGGDVQFDQAVGGLDGLTISGAGNVRFGAGLSLDGDLVIDATGTVTFAGPITLNNGARLIVRGTANVVFASAADFGTGDVTLQTAAIAATGGIGSLRGTGLFALQGTAAATPVYVGSGAPAGALQVGDDVLRAVGSGFGALRIGSGASAVTIADSDFSRTGATVQVEGSSIAIATTGAGMRYATEVSLHATGAITASGQVLATTPANLTLRSDSGAITMGAGSLLRTLGGDVTLDAPAGLAVAGIDARSGGGGGGLVLLHTAGLVVDANANAGVDVYARGVTLSGLGPEYGGGDVLEVAAPLVRVDSPLGVVVRETGTDGRTYFNVVNGSELRQALVAVGGASRVTSDLDAFIAGGGQQSLASVAPPSSALQTMLAAMPSALAALNGSVQLYLASSAMPATDPGLTLAERLQAESELSFASGQAAGGQTVVDYWSESLSL